eukprot:TRINITY_DN13961_c1_g7_i1.p1 TRINITY_DN13961_c1_g7~~TRINITY_DN13961_c1_g7_i1.p1  ORF type:complete len:904 (-),score=188.74 TRINITY_DN13961_c1_g7_i1:45-2756(-)
MEPQESQASGSTGSLLRLFRSEVFDVQLHMHYLLRMEQSGVQDYLVNELYKMGDDDVDYYLPQLCQLALLRYKTSCLHRFLLDKAGQSVHFALKIVFLMQSFVEDKTPEIWESAVSMANGCEIAIVNSTAAPLDALEQSWSDHVLDSDAGRSPMAARSKSCPVLFRRGSPPADDDAAEEADEQSEEAADANAASASNGGSKAEVCSADANGEREAEGTDGALSRSTSVQSTETALGYQPTMRHLAQCLGASSQDEKAAAYGVAAPMPNPYGALGEPAQAPGLGTPGKSRLDVDMQRFMLKQRRCDYFNTQNHLVLFTAALSTALVTIKSDRLNRLRQTLRLLNRWLFDRQLSGSLSNEGPLSALGLRIPIGDRSSRQQIARMCVDLCRVFSTATRAPFLLVYETVDYDEVQSDDDSRLRSPSGQGRPPLLARSGREPLASCLLEELTAASAASSEATGGNAVVAAATASTLATGAGESAAAGAAAGGGSAAAPAQESAVYALRRQLLSYRTSDWDSLTARMLGASPATASDASAPSATSSPPPAARASQRTPPSGSPSQSRSPSRRGSGGNADDTDAGTGASGAPNSPGLQRFSRHSFTEGGSQSSTYGRAKRARRAIWGEPWSERAERIRKESAFGRYKSWSLETIFVKGGDDLRQELLAAQVIRQFRDVFRDAQLPLWLLDMEVLVTSATSGITSFIRDSTTVDNMKKLYPGRTLAEIFRLTFADQLFEAKRNFIESYAAYSLVVWFLQVKDRHNGNLMMLSDGRVVHIDFGFMLSNSPGHNMAFEQSPFMLTQEFLDVMEGEYSAEYEYFRTLIIRGFLEARKQIERITLPIRMMVSSGSKLPCFREGGEWVMQSLQERFFVALPEEACIDKILELIDTSVNNWRTITYHNIQRFTNGIL